MPEKLAPAISALLTNSPVPREQVEAFAKINRIMSTGNTSRSVLAADIVLAAPGPANELGYLYERLLAAAQRKPFGLAATGGLGHEAGDQARWWRQACRFLSSLRVSCPPKTGCQETQQRSRE